MTSNALESDQPEDDSLESKSIFSSSNDMNLCDTTSNLSSENLSPPSPLIATVKQELPMDSIDNATIGTDHNIVNLYNTIDDDPIGHLANSDFDITKYVNETDKYCRNPEIILPSGPGPGGKRLDLKNQRYVVDSDSDDSDEDHIDIETVSETNASLEQPDEGSSSDDEESTVKISIDPEKILKIKQEHPDLIDEEHTYMKNNNEKVSLVEDTILKTEIKNENNLISEETHKIDHIDLALPYNIIDTHIGVQSARLETRINNMIMDLDMKNANLDLDRKLDDVLDIDVQKIEESNNIKMKIPAIEAGDLNSLLEQFEASETTNKKSQENVLDEKVATTEDQRKDPAKSKQILESLPEELINRIKQSSKRKSIPVIPPIPTKKKSKSAIQASGVAITTSCETVQMDHDYCISVNSSKKDSGFSSCEEDDRSLLRNQPTVKTADGKLMVSLLKVNTIKKRKLNLEEYKQRRKGRSCSGSPARIEDENARRLQRMNIQLCAPSNMEVKTLVSIGVNTDQSWGRLQEIVRSCPVNFSPNSLITSLVEHLPQVKEIKVSGEHGEDKTIVYLDKNRVQVKTASKRTQTITHRRRSSSSSSSSSRSSRSRTRSPSPTSHKRRTSSEKMREVEERRVVYVGRIANSVTRECLRKRFQRFGVINNVSVHFRRTSDNFGFVTFKYKEDAYNAVEHGNEDPNLPQYDLSFGGRRIFCQTTYADLDNLRDDCAYMTGSKSNHENSFEELLRETQAKLLRNRRMNGKS